MRQTVRLDVFEVLMLTISVAKCSALAATIKSAAGPGLWYLFNRRMIGGSALTAGPPQVRARNIGVGL